MLEIRNLSKNFSHRSLHSSIGAAVDSLNLTINEGEFFSLLGPSGCGKTTLLRMISGLEFPSSGEIFLRRARIDQLPAQERPFNMVFQKYALFPHLSVFENVAFGLRLKALPQVEITARVRESLELVNMLSFERRLPETLSGGQSQRVAIARALVNRPQILLLDEPLSALDQKLREHMQSELKQLQKKLGLTFIYVTHDQEEALALSDRIGVMNSGRLEQVSTPEELYRLPNTLFAAQFVGAMNILPSQFVEQQGPFSSVNFHQQILNAHATQGMAVRAGLPVLALVRPERLKILPPEAVANGLNVLSGKVKQLIFRGPQTEVLVQIENGFILRVLVPSEGPALRIDLGVRLAFQFEDTLLFPKDS